MPTCYKFECVNFLSAFTAVKKHQLRIFTCANYLFESNLDKRQEKEPREFAS